MQKTGPIVGEVPRMLRTAKETLPQVLERMMTNIKSMGNLIDFEVESELQNTASEVDHRTTQVIQGILDEHRKACAKFPNWQTDPIHALAVIQEELGELTQAILDTVYGGSHGGVDNIRSEAQQAGVMIIRFLENMDKYKYTQGARV